MLRMDMAKLEITRALTEDAKRILGSHLIVGPEKTISYLPIKTIENVIGITVPVYRSMIENLGNKSAVFLEEECCIYSGAVYAYSETDLDDILRHNRKSLVGHGWPIAPADFIRRIASEWLAEKSPILDVVKKAFGEE